MESVIRADALLIGCGDLGQRIGRRLAADGRDVAAIRRRAHLVPAPIRGIAADLTASEPLPDVHAELLVVALTADRRDEDGYREVYVDGMRRALDAATRDGRTPRRAVLVSSTGVLGDGDGWVDEATEPAPARPTAKVLLEAEKAFMAAIPHGIIARASGLYGESPRMIEQVRRGENPDPGRWANRIHRDDAAAAVVHLLTSPSVTERLYHLTDDEPATNGAARAFIAEALGLAPWPRADAETHGKRLSNRLLRGSGFELRYPSYREGYAEALAQ